MFSNYFKLITKLQSELWLDPSLLDLSTGHVGSRVLRVLAADLRPTVSYLVCDACVWIRLLDIRVGRETPSCRSSVGHLLSLRILATDMEVRCFEKLNTFRMQLIVSISWAHCIIDISLFGRASLPTRSDRKMSRANIVRWKTIQSSVYHFCLRVLV